MKTEHITIEIRPGEDIELTPDECRKLYELLRDMQQPIFPTQPAHIDYDKWLLPPYEVT